MIKQNKELVTKLKQILELSKKIEMNSLDVVESKELSTILELIESLNHFKDFEVQKIISNKIHFKNKMTLKSFINFLIPIERLLNKNVSDDHFLVTSLDKNRSNAEKQNLIFILENIRSAFNLGSIIRLSDCLNIKELALTGYTPAADHPQVLKTSLGSTEYIKTINFKTTEEAILNYKNLNFKVFGIETAKNAKKIYDVDFFQQQVVFLFGNERFGVDLHSLSLCDDVIEIPTLGFKNSMNIANAVSVVGYEYFRQNQVKK